MDTGIETRLDAYKLLHDGILALSRAEAQGMRVDVEYCYKKKAHLTRKIEKLTEDFKRTKFYYHWHHIYKEKTNIDSDYQLAHILYDVRKLKPLRQTPGGRGSVDEESLLQLDMPELRLRIEISKLEKLRDVYLDAFAREQVDCYLHPFFNLHTVRTHRSSSDHPNFQNIPKRDHESMNICRRAILPRPGHQLGEVDYSGIEVRIGICYHKDPNMLKYVTDPTTDMHGDMCQQCFKIDDFDRKIPEYKHLRDATKNGFVFPQFYGSFYGNCAENLAISWGKLTRGKWKSGQGVSMPDGAKLSDHLIEQGISSFEDFKDHIEAVEKDFWENRFRVYQQWKDEWWEEYQGKGYFDTLTGFRCSGVMGYNDVINYPVQGSAFHCLLWSFIQIDKIMREEKWDTRLVGQIHDAIVLDINPSELDHVMKTVRRVACEELPRAWKWIIVPLEVEADLCEVDRPWNEKKPHKLGG